jgi:hypothetical protein
MEPIDADDWLHTIKNNLEVASVGKIEKVFFPTHFLVGPARTWCENIQATQPPGQALDLEAFKTKFLKAYIPLDSSRGRKKNFTKSGQEGMATTSPTTQTGQQTSPAMTVEIEATSLPPFPTRRTLLSAPMRLLKTKAKTVEHLEGTRRQGSSQLSPVVA